MIKYFLGSYIFSAVAFIVAFFWAHHAHVGTELSCLFIVFILSILEVSLSFDNAVVNALKLEKMSPLWRHRFLTWGILIAVFGMRFLFPVLVVSIFSHLNFFKVVDMALNDSATYVHYLHLSHPSIITFGGSFLILLFFTYFLNPKKEIHWIKPIEKKLHALSSISGLGVVLTLLMIYTTVHYFIPANNQYKVFLAGVCGIITYLMVEGVSSALEAKSEQRLEQNACSEDKIPSKSFSFANSCFINFLYLELIDASFSLDGVLGAFALSNDIVIITLGLAIGAMFVRSLTIMLVEKKTLKQFIYLEHGAHWAIGALAVIMFISSFKEVSEIITGVIGLVFIISALISSVVENKRREQK